MADWVVGVDLGATKIEVGLVSPQNQIVGRKRIPTNAIAGPQSVVERIAQTVADLAVLLPENEKIAGLGICSPGPVDYETGCLIDPPNLAGLHNAPLRKMLSDRLNVPVSLDHDAKSTGLGEFYFGAGRGEQSMVYIIIGTGVGAAIIENGLLLRGKDNSAGEVGHVTLDPHGELCSCGSRGCVETYMGGPWLAKRYLKALAAGAGSERIQAVDLQPLTGEQVANLALSGDPLAQKIIIEAGEALGIAVATMAMILNVELFVVGASVAKLGDLLLEPARRMVLQHSYRSVGCGVKLVTSEINDDSAILGCAWQARQAAQATQSLREGGVSVSPALHTNNHPASHSKPDEKAWLEAVEGRIVDIQRFSVHDGPGIRTSIFFKGCALRCEWCANPETQRPQAELAFSAQLCMNCGQYVDPCGEGWAHGAETQLAREKYGARVADCPTCGIHWLGIPRTAGDIMNEVSSDLPFFTQGGGITLTGGDPTYQPRLAEALLRLARMQNIDTAIETSGHTRYTIIERLLPYLDHILYDLKTMDSEKHRRHTGVDNLLILSNLEKLVFNKAPVQIRVPLIPGFNADESSLRAIAEHVLSLEGLDKNITLLPYHTLGRSKYKSLGRPYPWDSHERLSDAEVAFLAQVLLDCGVSVEVGG